MLKTVAVSASPNRPVLELPGMEQGSEGLAVTMAAAHTGYLRDLAVCVRPQEHVRVRSALHNVQGSHVDGDARRNCVVHRRLQVDILAQYKNGLDVGPIVGDLVDVPGDPDAAGAVNHLLLDDASRLLVQLAEQDLPTVCQHLQPVCVVGRVLARQILLISCTRERQSDVHGSHVEAKPRHSCSHAWDGRTGRHADGFCGLMEHVAAVHDGRCDNRQRAQPPVNDESTQSTPVAPPANSDGPGVVS
ncbi:hypothetical protein OG216_27460 [Streptomycetaceae bacterium NBC_01309]